MNPTQLRALKVMDNRKLGAVHVGSGWAFRQTIRDEPEVAIEVLNLLENKMYPKTGSKWTFKPENETGIYLGETDEDSEYMPFSVPGNSCLKIHIQDWDAYTTHGLAVPVDEDWGRPMCVRTECGLPNDGGPMSCKHTRPLLILSAVRAEVGKEIVMGTAATMEEAVAVVENLEASGKWPEGFEAILDHANGAQWMYSDQWDQLQSPGHMGILPGYDNISSREVYERDGEVYFAPLTNVFDDGYRVGRWECSRAHWDHYSPVVHPDFQKGVTT